MKDSVLYTPSQRAVALTAIARQIFKPEFVNQVLDEPHEELKALSLIQHARTGIEQFREAERYLKADIVHY
ncbi:MAG: hypothetical protein LRZ85_08030 [Alphaproteobacteria bacterium]|nr:hypothetical protein [Alphaproteobacteria bacterium]MCD8570765.1 hypothetical protein [Alphaproteobacteria bacterium]